jgi:hypothetical protein
MKRLGVTVGVSCVAVLMMAVMTRASGTRRVDIRDECDPATFNAAIGPGTCVGDGDVTFNEFLSQLNPVDFGHEDWRFNFGRGKINLGETLQAVNRGGEFHTFTEVKEFGGGCVPFINNALGLPSAPDCSPQIFADTGVAPGNTHSVAGLENGPHKFQCLIHPWMRTVIDVRN